MNNSPNDAAGLLASQSEAVGRLAQDSGGFAAVFAAFESKDASAFRWVLDRLEMLPYCELICEWVRIKLCVLRCLEVCGPLRENERVPSFEEFVHAVVRLTSDEKHLRRVVDAVSCGDASAYQAAIRDYELGEFCHLICHWVCSVELRRVCEVVCRPEPALPIDPASEITATGKVLASVIANKRAFEAIGRAAAAPNCTTLQSTLNDAGFIGQCEIICRFICTWRRVWVCRTLCQAPVPIVTGVYAIEEAQKFALATQKLAAQPRALGDLVSAVQNVDAKAYSAIIQRYSLEPYCWQVCGWVSTITCHEFCYCVCPPADYPPLFTTVGNFDIYTQIDSTTGLTNTQVPHPFPPAMPFGGGPNFAFYSQLQLGGFCPGTSPAFPGQPMQYRFLYATAKSTLAAAINTSQTSITVASGAITPPVPFDVSVCVCLPDGETSETMTVTGVSTTTWTVTRGTPAAAAPAGVVLLIAPSSPAPITGPAMVDTPVMVGQRWTTWPAPFTGVLGPTLEPVYVGYGKDPVAPTVFPFLGSPAHYIEPDLVTGWIEVDSTVIAGGDFTTLLQFDSSSIAPGGDPLPGAALAFGAPGGVPAGTAVPSASQRTGADVSIIFQATRVAALPTVDYSNSLCQIHINNWAEVNNLWFAEFATGCCTPIDATLTVQFTVDHEEMGAGGWSLGISSCALPPGGIDLTPPDPTTGVVFTAAERGASGQIVVDTSTWCNCSYAVELDARPGLTTGMSDYPSPVENLLTFAICNHDCPTLTAAINATQTTVTISSSAGFSAAPFNVSVPSTGETMTVTNVAGTTWTVLRGQAGTTASAAAAGASVIELP